METLAGEDIVIVIVRIAHVIAEKLEASQEINWVKHPFLKSHPQYALAKKQMLKGGNIIAFELKGGIDAGTKFYQCN